MPNRAFKPCARCGVNLTRDTYCDECKPIVQRDEDKHRGSAYERGYTAKWQRYSKRYLRQPEHLFCAKCGALSECVDHIKPCAPGSPEFFDPDNHQPLCIRCNSAKGKREVRY